MSDKFVFVIRFHFVVLALSRELPSRCNGCVSECNRDGSIPTRRMTSSFRRPGKKRSKAALSFATQWSIDRKLSRAWVTKLSLLKGFPLLTLLCICLWLYMSPTVYMSWHRGTKCNSKRDWLWIQSLLEKIKYSYKCIFSSLWCRGKEWRWIPPLNTQCQQNSAKSGERYVLL